MFRLHYKHFIYLDDNFIQSDQSRVCQSSGAVGVKGLNQGPKCDRTTLLAMGFEPMAFQTQADLSD